MRTFDFTPLYRSTVGFDQLFDLLDSTERPDWPPYDIEKVSEDEYRISMAVAGFKPSELEITQEGSTLTVVGRKEARDERQLLHHGIATRNFRQIFNLADHVKVTSAGVEDGMLSVGLVREVPEQLKPRKIEIGKSTPSAANQQLDQKQLGQTSTGQAKAA
jgi:molecular chaperone IbpA